MASTWPVSGELAIRRDRDWETGCEEQNEGSLVANDWDMRAGAVCIAAPGPAMLGDLEGRAAGRAQAAAGVSLGDGNVILSADRGKLAATNDLNT